MENLNRSIKLSLTLGLTGAVILPIIYETYANVSAAAALFLAFAAAVFAGVKFSFLAFKEAFLGITCTIAYSGVLGWIFYLFIHPKIENMLWERSVYFQLTVKEQLMFVLYCFLISLCMYLIWAVKFGLCKAVRKIKSNREQTGRFIDHAFEDDEDKL